MKRMVFAVDASHPVAWLVGCRGHRRADGVVAAYPPAMRAASIDPTTALRAE